MNRKACFSLLFVCCVCLGFVATRTHAEGQEPPVSQEGDTRTELSEHARLTFEHLRASYATPLLDKGFKTLRALSEDRDYLAYLSKPPAAEKPFQTFAAFFKNAIPSKERYLPFFETHLNVKTLEEITDTDHKHLHKMSEYLWRLDVQQLHGKDIAASTMIPFLTDTLMTQEVQAWMIQRKIVTRAHAGAELGQFFLNLMLFNLQVVLSDTQRVNTFFETYGQDDGWIRLAIEAPLLFGRILSSFTDREVFVKWTQRRRIQ